MVIVTEWDFAICHETLREILDSMNWEDYMNYWKPSWQFQNTQVLYANLQPHGDLQRLVPERKVYPKSTKWIHDMVFDHSRHLENLAEDALTFIPKT